MYSGKLEVDYHVFDRVGDPAKPEFVQRMSELEKKYPNYLISAGETNTLSLLVSGQNEQHLIDIGAYIYGKGTDRPYVVVKSQTVTIAPPDNANLFLIELFEMLASINQEIKEMQKQHVSTTRIVVSEFISEAIAR